MHRVPWDLLLGATLAMALVGAGLFTAQSPALLGFEGGELWGHAWTQWWHGEALPAWPAGTPLATGSSEWPVIDPLTTGMAAALGRLLGYTAAWNLTLLAGVGLAYLGGAVLARQEQGSAPVGGMVLALGPVFLGSLASGLTEDAALGLLPLAFAGLRSGSRRGVLAGGALLGLSAGFGLYLAYLGGLAALALGLHALLRPPRRWGLWIGAGLLALALGALFALGQGERLSGEGHRAGQLMRGFEPAWRLNPWAGADLASFFVLGQVSPPEGAMMRLHPVALGLIPLALAFYGGRSVWWVLLLGAMTLSTGAELRWRGEPLGAQNPAVTLLHALPFGDLLNHHGRLMLIGQIALAVLAARGAQRLGRVGPGLAALLAVELLFFSPAPLPLPLSPAQVDPIWAALPQAEGCVLVLPPAGPGVPFQRPLYEQRAHGRPLCLSPNRPGLAGALGEDPTARWLASLAFPGARTPDLDWTGLQEAGVGLLVVREAWVEKAMTLLGPPAVSAEGGAVWPVGSAPQHAPEGPEQRPGAEAPERPARP